MREERKKIIKQWLPPIMALVMVIAGLLIYFNITSRRLATEAVEKDLVVAADRYSRSIYTQLRAMSNAALMTGEALHNLDDGQQDRDEMAYLLLRSLISHSSAHMAIISDSAGAGITHNGEKVDMSRHEYFADLTAGSDGAMMFIEDDGFYGTKAIVNIHALPGDDGGWVLAYYPIAGMGDVIGRSDFDGNILFMLLSSDGKILAHNRDIESNFLKSENLTVNLTTDFREEVRTMERRLTNSLTGSFKAEMDGEARTLAYTPFPLNKWYVIVGVNEYYVDRMENRQWELPRRTLFQLALVIGIFTIIMVLINMISKLRGTSKTKELMEKADTDLLTGLSNKVATERKISDYMTTHPNEQAIMFVLDIDNFKKINDTMGHAFGDEVLRSIGEQITPMFRSSDVVGRIGGDEMIILLKNINSDEILLREATKVARFFHDFKCGEYVKYSATASVGAAIFPRDGKDFETMYKAADQALYMAKKRGKNQLAFYHDTFEAVKIM